MAWVSFYKENPTKKSQKKSVTRINFILASLLILGDASSVQAFCIMLKILKTASAVFSMSGLRFP